jgi:undecaprenyl pyrophosphate synthase
MKALIEETKNNTATVVTFALSYGGRTEILETVNKLLKEKKDFVDEKNLYCISLYREYARS